MLILFQRLYTSSDVDDDNDAESDDQSWERSLSETLYHRDDALLYMAYVMLIWAAPIPADRWHCSLWP